MANMKHIQLDCTSVIEVFKFAQSLIGQTFELIPLNACPSYQGSLETWSARRESDCGILRERTVTCGLSYLSVRYLNDRIEQRLTQPYLR